MCFTCWSVNLAFHFGFQPLLFSLLLLLLLALPKGRLRPWLEMLAIPLSSFFFFVFAFIVWTSYIGLRFPETAFLTGWLLSCCSSAWVRDVSLMFKWRQANVRSEKVELSSSMLLSALQSSVQTWLLWVFNILTFLKLGVSFFFFFLPFLVCVVSLCMSVWMVSSFHCFFFFWNRCLFSYKCRKACCCCYGVCVFFFFFAYAVFLAFFFCLLPLLLISTAVRDRGAALFFMCAWKRYHHFILLPTSFLFFVVVCRDVQCQETQCWYSIFMRTQKLPRRLNQHWKHRNWRAPSHREVQKAYIVALSLSFFFFLHGCGVLKRLLCNRLLLLSLLGTLVLSC